MNYHPTRKPWPRFKHAIKRVLSPRQSVLSNLSGIYAMAPEGFAMLEFAHAKIRSLSVSDLRAMLTADDDGSIQEADELTIDGEGIAHLALYGMLVQKDASLFREFGMMATGTEELMSAIMQCAEDPNVKGLAIHVDSPGGSISGVPELSDLIGEASERFPEGVCAYIRNQCASGALWAICQASEIYAWPSSMVGSIGTFNTMVDSSKAHEAMGVKVHVISTGPNKGAGVPGTPITDGHIEAAQQNANAIGEEFLADLMAGRELSEPDARALMSGEAWPAKDAMAKGLIDGIESPTLEKADEMDGDAGGMEAADPESPYANGIKHGEPDEDDMQRHPLNRPHQVALATEGDSMATMKPVAGTDELAELRKALELEKAARLKAEGQLILAQAFEKDAVRDAFRAVIVKHQNRGAITPAMLPAVEKAAEAYGNDYVAFDKDLATYQAQIHTRTVAGIPERKLGAETLLGQNPEAPKPERTWTEDEVNEIQAYHPDVRRWLEIHEAVQASGANSMRPDGTLTRSADLTGNAKIVGRLPNPQTGDWMGGLRKDFEAKAVAFKGTK